MINTRTVWRKVWDFFLFENVSIFGVFDRNGYGNGREDVGVGVGIGIGTGIEIGIEIGIENGIGVEIEGSGDGFLVSCNINNRECKELIPLGIEMTSR